MKRCKKCGTIIVEDGMFCPRCGSQEFIVVESTNHDISVKS